MIFNLFGRLVQFALMFATIRVMTTLLEPQQYGLLSLYLSVNVLFGFVFINPVGTFINRHLVVWKSEGGLVSKFWLFLPYWFFVACLSLLTLLLLRHFEVSFVGESLLALLTCSLLVFSSTLFNTLIPSLNLLGYDKPFVLLTVLGSLLILALSSLFVSFANGSAEGWLAGMVVAQLLVVAVCVYVYRRLGFRVLDSQPEKVHLVLMKSIIPFAWPVLVYTGLGWLTFQSYRFIVEDSFSLIQLGLMVAGYSVAIQILAATEQIANTWFLPRFYAACDSDNKSENLQASAEYIVAVGLPIILASAFILSGVDILLKLMLGPAFQQTQIYLVVGVLIEAFRIIANCAGLRFHQSKQTIRLIWPALFAFLLVAIINWSIEKSLILIVSSMAAGSLLLLIMMMDKNLLQQILLICRKRFNMLWILLFVANCIALSFSQQFLSIESHAMIWVSVWSVIGFLYLRSVLTQVARA